MADGRTRWCWHEANRLRVRRNIDVAERINGDITAVSVIGPQAAEGEGFTKGKASTKRMAEAAAADCEAPACEAAADKMATASPAAAAPPPWSCLPCQVPGTQRLQGSFSALKSLQLRLEGGC